MKTVILLISLTALALTLICTAQSSSLAPTASLGRCLGSIFGRRNCPLISSTCQPDDIIDEVEDESYWWGSSQPPQCLTGCKVCVSELPNCVVPCLLFLPSCPNGQRLTNQVLFRRGRQCQGCQICQDRSTCPEKKCAPAPPCKNLQRIGTTILPDGTVCEGCPFCDPEDVICQPRGCAFLERCIQPNNPNTNTFDFFGKQCPDCPDPCPIICPEKKCAPAPQQLFCRNLQTIGAISLFDGSVCEGCSFCDPEDVICQPLPCVFPGNCNQPNTNTFEFFGKTCPGCPPPCPIEPISPGCPFACLACAPPPGYVAPPPDKDGCVPCPPCGGAGAAA